MKLGAPVDLSEEELASITPAEQPAAKLGAPIDPLTDFDVYNAVEDAKEASGGYDPDDPGVAAKVWSAVNAVIDSVPGVLKGVATLTRAAFPQHGVIVPKDVREAEALTTQTGGKLLSNYSTLGHGAATVAKRAGAAVVAAVSPAREQEMKQLSRQAAFEFENEAKSAEEFSSQFNRHLETIFPVALQGLGSIPVDADAVNGLSMLLDPANAVPAGAAARWTTQVPLRGAVGAAKAALREAARDVAVASAKREAATLMLNPSMSAAERGDVWSKMLTARDEYTRALQRQNEARKALASTAASQRAVVDELATQASQSPLITRALSAAAQGVGAVAETAGRGLDFAAGAPEKLAGVVARGADPAAQQAVAQGVRNVAGAFGALPAAAGLSASVLRSGGKNLSVYGSLLAQAEGQLPFFKDLARQTTGLTSFTASLVDESGLGRLVVPAARAAADATRGMPFAAAQGYLASGGKTEGAEQGAATGMVFGLAGGAYGQWQRYSSGAAFRQRQLADVQRYQKTLPTSEARSFFDALPGADQAAVATMQLAHPDLKIQYSRMGKDRPSFYYTAEDGPVAMINMDTREPLPAVLAHEIGHHVEKHGLGPAIDRVILGDALVERPGLFTQLDAEGKPVKTAAGAFATNEEWGKIKDAYNARLQGLADKTGDAMVPRTDQQIARELFAEHTADYLLGRDGSLDRDLRATVWSRAIAALGGSDFVGNVPTLRSALGKLGAPLAQGDKRVVGSELFPGGFGRSADLDALIRRYHRASSGGRVPTIDDEPGFTRYTPAEVKQHPQIIERLFDGTDDVKRGPGGKVLRDKDGAPVFNTPKEQAEARAAFATEIVTALEEAPPPGARVETVALGKNGKTEEGWVTPAIPDPVLDKLAKSGKYNPVQIEHLRLASQAIQEGQGKSVLFFYQPASKAGRKYESLAGDWRTETPYAIFVSKAGNVLLRTMSREKLMSNVQEMVSKKRATLWNNDLSAVVADVDRYLANHAAGKPGADGIGVEKRDQINALFGINTKLNRSANPLIESSPRSPIVIRSRRIDRTNKMTPVEEYFPTKYDKLNANLRPE